MPIDHASWKVGQRPSPLAEQRRIVAKVDELMAVLDALAAALTVARATAASLLAATVARLHAA